MFWWILGGAVVVVWIGWLAWQFHVAPEEEWSGQYGGDRE